MKVKRFLFVFIVLALVFAASQPVLSAQAQQGPAPLVGADAARAIAGRYIVVFHDDVPQEVVDRVLSRVASEPDVVVHYVYQEALRGFAADLPARVLASVLAERFVSFVEVDQEVSLDVTQSPATWGIDRIDQRALPLSNSFTYSNTGAGVKAYIVDTGIRITHTEFGGRASIGTDTVGDGQNGNDCNGHGTHVAGTVGGSTYGVAKGVSLIAVRVLNCSGSGTTSGVIAGVDWVTSNHQAGQPAVANMSLGGGASTSLDSAVQRAITDGVTFSVSAGNSGIDACRQSPARVAAALTVGATDNKDTRASWSNYGSCLDLFAPGVNITSSVNTSDTATAVYSGTSMASPHVAGVAALYLQSNPGASPATVSSALTANATTNVVINPGKRSPNRLLFTNY